MRWASLLTIAVLPTPGSPMSTGLFFVRRCSTWIVDGSPRRADDRVRLALLGAPVRSGVLLERHVRVSSAFGSLTCSPPRSYHGFLQRAARRPLRQRLAKGCRDRRTRPARNSLEMY